MDLDRLVAQAQSRAEEKEAVSRQWAAAARGQYEVAAKVADVYRGFCRQVAERL